MRSLAYLLVLAGAGYLIYTQGLPKWEEHKAAKAASSTESDQAVRCVNQTESVVRSFSSGMRQFSTPPVDRDNWGTWFRGIGGELSSAESACSGPTDAARKASGALYDLRDLLGDLDRFVADGGGPVLDAPSRLERINRMVAGARIAALSG
jgi:hypothetical protein